MPDDVLGRIKNTLTNLTDGIRGELRVERENNNKLTYSWVPNKSLGWQNIQIDPNKSEREQQSSIETMLPTKSSWHLESTILLPVDPTGGT